MTLGSRIVLLVIINTAVVSLLSLLVVHSVLPLYVTALTTYPLLLAVNIAVIWKAVARRDAPVKTTKLGRLMWFPAIFFTATGAVAIAGWIRDPDLQSSVQAILAVTFAGWIWFLVAYPSRSKAR